MSLDERKKQMINKIILGLQAEGKFLEQDTTKTSEQKLLEMNVLVDTVRFLKDYEQNIKVLNTYLSEHKWETKKQQEKATNQDDIKERE